MESDISTIYPGGGHGTYRTYIYNHDRRVVQAPWRYAGQPAEQSQDDEDRLYGEAAPVQTKDSAVIVRDGMPASWPGRVLNGLVSISLSSRSQFLIVCQRHHSQSASMMEQLASMHAVVAFVYASSAQKQVVFVTAQDDTFRLETRHETLGERQRSVELIDNINEARRRAPITYTASRQRRQVRCHRVRIPWSLERSLRNMDAASDDDSRAKVESCATRRRDKTRQDKARQDMRPSLRVLSGRYSTAGSSTHTTHGTDRRHPRPVLGAMSPEA